MDNQITQNSRYLEFDNYYLYNNSDTSKLTWIPWDNNEALQDGKNVILEIELNGARQVRKNSKNAILIFIEPPSWEELTARLINRGTESEQSTQARLDRAKEELSAAAEFDYVVINHQVEQSVAELVSLALR